MRIEALVFNAPGEVECQSRDLSSPGDGEAAVRVDFTAISPGTEMLLYRGQMPQGLQADTTIAALDTELAYPLQYGYCAVGEICAVGTGVDSAHIGRNVFAFQPHQSGFNAPINDLLILPETLLPQDAVFLPNMETALGLVMDGAPLAGERVAVLGQGIVGLLTASLLAGFPLDELVTFDRYPTRRSASQSCGVSRSIDPESLPSELRHSFDLVYELTGSPAALEMAMALTGTEGRIVIGSWYGTKRAPLDLGGHFHRGRLKLISSQVSTLAPHLSGRWTKARRMAFAQKLVGRFRPSRLITHRFRLSEAAEAYRLIDQEPHQTIQVVFEYV